MTVPYCAVALKRRSISSTDCGISPMDRAVKLAEKLNAPTLLTSRNGLKLRKKKRKLDQYPRSRLGIDERGDWLIS